MTAEDVDEDSNAVLAFEDARVPVDRFIMRTTCEVMRHSLETRLFDIDERGRWILPMPGQSSAKFRNALDVLHGLKPAWHYGTLAEVLDMLECMDYLGSTTHNPMLEAKLWCLIREQDLNVVLGHASRLLRNPMLAADVTRKLIRCRPLWHDFFRDVLLAVELDATVIRAIVSYTPNFFPPSFVLWWALDASKHLPGVSQHLALQLAGLHGVMYHPQEAMSMLGRMGRFGTREGWDASLTGMLKNFAQSTDKYDMLPGNASKAFGSLIKFYSMPMASVLVTLETVPKRSVRLTPWLKLVFGDTFDVHFRPRKIDTDSEQCTALQLRVMCFEADDGPQGAFTECWHLFSIGADIMHSLANAHETVGDPLATPRMLRLKPSRQLRLDFFYGATSVLHNPFDPTTAAQSTITFLSL